MTAIPVPTAGAPILDTWGAEVANKLNRMIVLGTTSDQATTSTSAQDASGLSFPVVSGRKYTGRIFGWYTCANTSQGLKIGWSCPGSGGVGMLEVYGNASATGSDKYRTGAALDGPTTVDSIAYNRAWYLDFVYEATANGTFKIQWARGGSNSTSPGVTLEAGCGGIVVEST